MKYLLLLVSTVLCITQVQALEPTTQTRTTLSVESRASYILCPDGTMIQPGEKCPEAEAQAEAKVDGHVTVLKASDNLDDDCDGDSCEAAPANHNTTRSNKTTGSLDNDCDGVDDDCDGISDTNICDGVTCPDGSCVATAEQCQSFEEATAKEIDKATPKLAESVTKSREDTGGTMAEDDWETPRTTAGGEGTGEEGTEASAKGYIKIDDIKGESNKAAYILCPDGTMIQPGEKCPETEASVSGYIKIDDIKGESNKAAYILCPDGTMIQPGEKCPETKDTTAEAANKGKVEAEWKIEEGAKAVEEEDDSTNTERRRGETTLKDVALDKEIDKSTPKFAESVRALDDDSDDDSISDGEENEKAAYILCPDGTMIQPGEKCPEKKAKQEAKIDGHVTILKVREDCDDEDEECSPELVAHELAHVVQQLSEDIKIEENAEVEVNEEDGKGVSIISGTESKSFLGFIKTNLEVKIKVDTEGNVIKVKRPWYSIFAW